MGYGVCALPIGRNTVGLVACTQYVTTLKRHSPGAALLTIPPQWEPIFCI